MKKKLASGLEPQIKVWLKSQTQPAGGVETQPLTADQILALLELPKNSEHGDLAFPCFALAKAVKKNPNLVAQELSKLNLPDGFSQVNVIGGYLNYFFDQKSWQNEIFAEIELKQEKIGNSNVGIGKTVVIDYSSPNVAKPMSIGHLRSTVIGQSLCNIYRASGFKVVGINYIGDWGVQFGKLAWAHLNNQELLRLAHLHEADVIKKGFDPLFWKKLVEDANLERMGNETVTFDYLFAIYVIFHAVAEFEVSLEDFGRQYFLKLESRKQNAFDLQTLAIEKAWKEFVRISLIEYERVYKLLGTNHDLVRGESYYEDFLQPIIKELRDKKLLVESEGAQVVDLSEDQMPPCLIQKKDGATLYATRDLAAALNRHDEFKADQLVYVVGAEQSLHFKQVFRVLEKMNYKWASDCHHVAFGLYRFKDGKMSTRRGNVILLEDVLDRAVELVRNVIKEKNPDLDQAEDVAKAVGTGAVIFNDLMNDRQKNIDFDWEKLLDFNGDTGPYVQYTQVRCASVLSKWGTAIPEGKDVPLLKEKLEKDLFRVIGRFDDAVKMALEQLKPSWIAQYLLELAKAFNSFYYEHRILEGDHDLQESRIALVSATRVVLCKGLSLLGVASPKAM